MVHQYKNNGCNIVLDVNSGAVHMVDDIAYDVIALYKEKTKEEITELLQNQYEQSEVEDTYEEVAELEKEGQLFQTLHG